MSGMFGIFGISGSGMKANRISLDAIADNIANMNVIKSTDDDAFQPRTAILETVAGDDGRTNGPGGGVRVKEIELGSKEGRLLFDPNHPLADDEGLVRAPDIDLGEQMTQMLVSQRGYQMNSTTIEKAKEMYQQAISILGRQ